MEVNRLPTLRLGSLSKSSPVRTAPPLQPDCIGVQRDAIDVDGDGAAAFGNATTFGNSVNVSHSGDTAHDNLGNSASMAEFVCQGCLNSMYDNITAYDSKQVYGLLLDSWTSYTHAAAIVMPLNQVPLLDMGYQDVYSP